MPRAAGGAGRRTQGHTAGHSAGRSAGHTAWRPSHLHCLLHGATARRSRAPQESPPAGWLVDPDPRPTAVEAAAAAAAAVADADADTSEPAAPAAPPLLATAGLDAHVVLWARVRAAAPRAGPTAKAESRLQRATAEEEAAAKAAREEAAAEEAAPRAGAAGLLQRPLLESAPAGRQGRPCCLRAAPPRSPWTI